MPQFRRGFPFMALAVAFLALGVAGNSAFFVLALAFFAISIVSPRLFTSPEPCQTTKAKQTKQP